MVEQSLIDFTQVDCAIQPAYFVSYLDNISEMEWIKAYKNKGFECLELKSGECILDVGCGTGKDVRMLSQVVGNTGLVVGVDASQTMIDEACSRTKELNLSVEYHVRDAHNLLFSDNTFNACRAERIFQYLANPQKALSEMIRVNKSGGRVVLQEPDWETLIVDVPNRKLTRKILNCWCDNLNSGWIGRQLFALYKKLGLVDVTVDIGSFAITNYDSADQIFHFSKAARLAEELDVVSTAESAQWLNDLKAADSAECFFSAINGFIVSGYKP